MLYKSSTYLLTCGMPEMPTRTVKMTRTYFGLDLGDGDGEIDGSGEAWNWKTAGRSAPADTVSVPVVILQVVCADHVDAVQPVVLVFPRLLPHSAHTARKYTMTGPTIFEFLNGLCFHSCSRL